MHAQVIDSDAVMVLDSGKLLEMDTPAALMRKQGGYFAAMCAEYGAEMEAELRRQAEEAEGRPQEALPDVGGGGGAAPSAAAGAGGAAP